MPRSAALARRRLDLSLERVAPRRIAGLVAGREPLLALFGRPVGPGVGVDLARRGFLDPVVADGCGRVERVRDLGVGERLEIAGRGGVVPPDAREAVGLELGPDGLALGARVITASALVEH